VGVKGSRLGADKELEKAAKQARKAGWEVTITGGNHVKWKSPDGVTAIISGLTGCGPGWIKVRNQLKKSGLHI
jgi:predicted RNA binding protein YcfA (HicA-like mRNA interferase family)